MPIPAKYVILASKEDEKSAKNLHSELKIRIANAINRKVGRDIDRKRFIEGIEIETVPVAYDDIWNLKKCSDALGKELTDKLRNENPTNKLVVNLVGGTTAAKTALFLKARQWLQSRPSTKLCIVTRDNARSSDEHDTRTPQLAYRGVSVIHPKPIGLLAQGIGTKNEKFVNALNRLERIVLTSRKERILITGPTGAGKSELGKLMMSYMQALHKDATEENCIHLNVAAIAPTLIESELFGHERGAFSGAIGRHEGVFKRADKGVVFLDEIGELPKNLQAKLLTVLDGVPFTRVGGTEKLSSDFLLLCGTNVDLEEACAKGTFRRDLFERLRTWTVEVPSINDRVEDLEVALQRERGEWLTKTGIEVLFDKDALSLFMEKANNHTWAGNFREFHATFVHLAMEADKGRITKVAVEDEFLRMDPISSQMTEAESGKIPKSVDGDEVLQAEKEDSISRPISDTTNFAETAGIEYNLADMARLACALDVCRKAKTASEAGEILFAARAETAKRNRKQFNGASSLQRLFDQFGLKATFKHGTFSLRSM